jgi:DNA-binding beta-propeller fold protein YncE
MAASAKAPVAILICALAGCTRAQGRTAEKSERSGFVKYRAPAGDRPATPAAIVEGRRGAILPNGRFVTPAGTEIDVGAPKPFGLAVSPDERTLATVNSGASTFSVTLIREPRAPRPAVTVVPLSATFMGVTFSPDGERFYASGGDHGNLWVGLVATGQVIGSVNLNGPTHPLDRPLSPAVEPAKRFKGAFPGNMTLTRDGRTLFVVDQAGFQVFAIDTRRIVTGIDAAGRVVEPDSFAAVAARIKVGRYPFGVTLSSDEKTLLVTNVGVFQYTHLRPATPTGDPRLDYPLCFPGVGYPDEGQVDKTIRIKKIDARKLSGLPSELRDPDGIRCGDVLRDTTYTIPALGSPNVPASSSVYLIDVQRRDRPFVLDIVRTGKAVGELDAGIPTYGASHPNAVVVVGERVYVSNGNHDSISILDGRSDGSHGLVGEIPLTVLPGFDRILRGVEPVALAASPDGAWLYVAEAGLNAVGVINLRDPPRPRLVGHIPAGWWPSSVKISADGRTLFVASAKGRGAPPNLDDQGPKHAVRGTVNVIAVPPPAQLRAETARVMRNNGFEGAAGGASVEPKGKPHPIPRRAGEASAQIRHVVLINKENATHDLLLGDITATRRGVAVEGEPLFSLGPAATPNHHELAMRYTLADNFFLEPAVSSDGHRWLTNMYTTEFEETHWPAASGHRRNSAGDDPELIANWPGRIGFSDANGSPDPHDYNEHGGIYAHLVRRGLDFVNFGNGFELSLVEEKEGTEPTGIRARANVPMEQVVRQRTDHLYPEFNTHIPDAPLPEDPDRFSRFGRFKQAFEAHYVDRARGTCNLPSYVDLLYPNDHGGGANDIHPKGPAWDFTRYVQDNDAALGLTVDLISKSPCWKDTVIFVVEDDTQNGLDHVNGHRSVFIAISPWVKRAHVSKTHLSLASIFKTVDLIFGIPPLNQVDAAATDLRDIFTADPDFSPYDYVKPRFVTQAKKSWRRLTGDIDFSAPDRDEVRLRRAIVRSEGLPRPAMRDMGREAASGFARIDDAAGRCTPEK